MGDDDFSTEDSSGDDPVARNRRAHPRRTPGRSPVGWPVTLRWIRLTAAAVVVATAVLIIVLAFGSA